MSSRILLSWTQSAWGFAGWTRRVRCQSPAMPKRAPHRAPTRLGLCQGRYLGWLGRWGVLLVMLQADAWVGAALGAEPSERVLVLRARIGPHESAELRDSLSQSLGQRGRMVLDPPTLSQSERSCHEIECLSALGSSLGASHIVVAQISELTQTATVWLRDLRQGITRKSKARLVESWAKTLDTALGSLLAQAELRSESLQTLQAPRAPTGPEPATPMGTAGAGPLPMAPRPGLAAIPAWRLGLGGALCGLSAVSLAVALAATASHGSEGPARCPMGTETECRFNLSSLFVPGYVTAGFALLGATLSLAWPSPRSRKKEMP